MSVLYCSIALGVADGVRLLDQVRDWASDGVLTDVQWLHGPGEASLALRRGESYAILRVRPLSRVSSERKDEPNKSEEWCVSFSPSDDDSPEAAALCWDALVAINTFSPTPVWISVLAYGAADLHHIGPATSLAIRAGGQGHLLTSTQFDALLSQLG